MLSIIYSLIIAAVLESAAYCAEIPVNIGGRVFLDANANGLMDAGEKGLAGIRLTDGVNIVTTAEDGSYSITVSPYVIRIDTDEIPTHRQAQTVGVCWPSGKWPTGRWWVRLSGVTDAKNVNFGLRDDAQTLPFTYLHHSDSHGAFPALCGEFAKFAGEYGAELKFIFDTGDTSWNLAVAEKNFKVPFFHTIGNHDIHSDKDPDLYGYGTWTREIGPIRWSFDYAGIRFSGFDVIEGDACGADWIEKDLKSVPQGGRVILFWHYPNPERPEKFLKMLKNYNVETALAGHNHTYVRWDWLVPMYTAYNFHGSGTANAAVVHKDGSDVSFLCLGCKGATAGHSRRCPIGWYDHVVMTSLGGFVGEKLKVDAGPVAGERPPVEIREARALVNIKFTPGKAKKTGLRIGAAEKPVEIGFAEDHLIVAGVPMRLKSRHADGSIELKIFCQKNLLMMWAEDLLFWEKDVQLETIGRVVVFAEGGEALINSISVREVKTDPARVAKGCMACNCAHGALRYVK